MARYSLQQERRDGEALVRLVDEAAGLEAEVVPGVGHNCARLTLARREGSGAPLAILAPPPDLAELRRNPVHYGNPILFPFPNRVRGGRFTFRGQTYQLAINQVREGNAIHGLVYGLPWEVLDAGASAEGGAWVTARFTSAAFPEVVQQFPFPFQLTLTYRLREGQLCQEIEAVNVGQGPMPMGFGIHPWFPLPLSGAGRREEALVSVPAAGMWELQDLLPTGRLRPVAGTPYDLRELQSFGQRELDDVYTHVQFEGEWSRCRLRDLAAQAEVEVAADRSFREWVVYAPLHRPVICFEPYTCTTDAFNLAAQGIDSGMRVLDPGQSWRGEIRIVPRWL